jgi:MFS family permease
MAVPEPRAVRRSLYLSVLDGVLHAVMVGMSESYLGAFAVELGHANTSLAFLSTVPMLVGAIGQLLASPVARLVGGRKRLVVMAAGVQAASHLAFIHIALTHETRLWPLLGAKILFWLGGSIGAPAWGAWMGALTSGVRRERYFAWRSAILNGALLVAFTSGGFVLESGRQSGEVLAAFALMHTIALAMRLSSSICLGFHADTNGEVKGERTLDKLRGAAATAGWRVPVYYASLMFGTYISAPFFTPYMLRELHLDFTQFSLLTAVSILTKSLFFPWCHRIAARSSVGRLMIASGAGVAVVPALWWWADSFNELILVQVVSGVAWAGMEFTNFQVLLRACREEHRMELMSLANGLAYSAQLAGAVTGSQLMAHANFRYVDVFILSGLLRTLPLALFSSYATRLGRPPLRLVMKLLSVRPVEGLVQRAVLASESERPNG